MNRVEQFIWDQLTQDVASLRASVLALELKTQRAETAGGIKSYTYAARPTAATTGGVSDNTNYLDLIFISNGRKVGEGAGSGTGCPAYYDTNIDDYRRLSDDTVVVI